MLLSSTANRFETFGEIGDRIILGIVVFGVISSVIVASPVAESSTVRVSSVNCAKTGWTNGKQSDCKISNVAEIAKVLVNLFENKNAK